MNDELTIIIPAKNEEKNIGKLLEAIKNQDYPLISDTQIYIADANSTDRTREIAQSFPNVTVIPGGMPSVGRNAGARLAKSRYLLFLDSDIIFDRPNLIRKSVDLMKRKNLHCVAAKLKCKDGRLGDRFLFILNNLVMYCSKYLSPFAVGMYILFDKSEFDRLGGFHEKVYYAEDYFLSKQVKWNKFAVVNGYILTENRRFKKMGYLKVARMFINTIFHAGDDSYFLKDHKYWDNPK